MTLVPLLCACALELGAGVDQANHQGSGNYWEHPFPATLSMRSGSWSAGVRGEWFRFGFEHMGRYTSTATVVDDGSWSGGAQPGCKPNSLCNKHTMTTEEKQYGLYATVLRTWAVSSSVRIGGELGGWYYRTEQQMWQPAGPGVGGGCSSISQRPGWLLGTFAERGPAALALTFRRNSDNNDCPALSRDNTLGLGFRYAL